MKQNNHILLCLHCAISLKLCKMNLDGIIVKKVKKAHMYYILLKNEYIPNHVVTYFIDVL